MQHANFIVNDRQARAKDIETLIEKAQTTVAVRTGIRLEPFDLWESINEVDTVDLLETGLYPVHRGHSGKRVTGLMSGEAAALRPWAISAAPRCGLYYLFVTPLSKA